MAIIVQPIIDWKGQTDDWLWKLNTLVLFMTANLRDDPADGVG